MSKHSITINTLLSVFALSWVNTLKAADSSYKPLHPTGDFEALSKWPDDAVKKLTEITVDAPPDAKVRMKQFEHRNDPENIQSLCLKLSAALEPDAKGLDKFRKLVNEKQYQKALDAYREFFFNKIRDLEKYNAYSKNLMGYQLKEGKDRVLYRVDPYLADLAEDCIYTLDDRKCLVGSPGQISWVPHGLELPEGAEYGRSGNDHLFWDTDEGKAAAKKIDLFRGLNSIEILLWPSRSSDERPLWIRLLESYVLTKNQDHLEKSFDIIDDWAMFSRKDIDACPIDIRNATELETERLRDVFGFMRVMVDERPELAQQFDSTTLARLTLRLLSDFVPYTIRAKRTELANWGIMGIGNGFHIATLFQEFKSMTYARQEIWRLWNINFTHYFSLDGASYEASDFGHSRIAVPRARECMPYCAAPDFVGQLERDEFDDILRDRMRLVVVEMTPTGMLHPRFDPDYESRTHEWLEPKWTTYDTVSAMTELLMGQDAEVTARMETILKNTGQATLASAPAVLSEVAPYAAMNILRESWEADAEYFFMSDYLGSSTTLPMRYVAHKSVIFGREPGRFDLAKSGRNLIVGNALSVDKKPCNFFYGFPKTGGKTRYCSQPPRNIAGHRFHTSSRFDLAEAVQDKPYERPPAGVRTDSHFFNLYNVISGLDNTPITDVKSLRQVFSVRGEGLYFVNTRIENESGAGHEYSQFFGLPAWVPVTSFQDAVNKVSYLRNAGHSLIIENLTLNLLATSNVDFDNVSIHLISNSTLTFANEINNSGSHVAWTDSQLDIMQDILDNPANAEKTDSDFVKMWEKKLVRPVSVRWTDTGNQVLVKAIATRAANSDEINTLLAGGLKKYKQTSGASGVLGCDVITKNGVPAWFQSGPQKINKLIAGPVKADGEALMAVKKDGEISGVVLGAKAVTINYKKYKLPTPDSEFVLASGGGFQTTPIRRPIDTVRISPAQNVFVDKIKVSFDIPTQNTSDIEYRYTLDKSDPTLASSLYTEPFNIDRTVMLKVRPFRKGLTETPWNFPGMDAGKTFTTILKKVNYKPAQKLNGLNDGLNYEYLESDWPNLFMNAGVEGLISVKGKGNVTALLDAGEVARIRKTDMAYAVNYKGYIDVPADGVYVFYAPDYLFDIKMDAGFDMRVFVDGEEWFAAPRVHAENTWSVALKKGLHDFKVVFTDFRYKNFKSEYWLDWQEEEVWQGIPVLEVSGPGIPKQPLPKAWLKYKN